MLLNNKYLEVIKEFSTGIDNRLYGRSIAKKLNMNQKTVANILNRLEKSHIIKFKEEGKNKYFFLNKLSPNLKDVIQIIEIEKKIILKERKKQFVDLFSKLEEKSSGIIGIFGSYANQTNNEKSDLDVFSIGKINEVEDLEKLYKIKINVLKIKKEKFNKEELIIKEIVKNHIILSGFEDFIKLIW